MAPLRNGAAFRRRRFLSAAAFLACPPFFSGRASAQPGRNRRSAVLISLDGLRPDYITKADEHRLKIPALRRLVRVGASSMQVRGVLPTVTYPSHTTLITGVSPARHGICYNHPFDPSAQNPNAWFWYAEDIRVPTLWDAAAAAGFRVGSISWPVTVGARTIAVNIPEYAGTRTPEDLKMLRALSPPGLISQLESSAGAYLIDVNQAIPRDWSRTRYAVEFLRSQKVDFLTVHLAATDHVQHRHGPFSPEAFEALAEVDKMVALLERTVLQLDPRAVVCVVSDHGFAPVNHYLKLDAAFVRAGLITLKAERETLAMSGVAAWEAMPWNASGSAAILLRNPSDPAVRARVARLLEDLAGDPANGIAAILDRTTIQRLGGSPDAQYWLALKSGYSLSPSLAGPLVTKVSLRGTHGHAPMLPEMDSLFVIAGENIRKGHDLGAVDMRSIAPTLARAAGIPFSTAEAEPLDVFVPKS